MLVLRVGSPKLVFLPQEGAAPELRPGPRSLRSRRSACSDPDQAAPARLTPPRVGCRLGMGVTQTAGRSGPAHFTCQLEGPLGVGRRSCVILDVSGRGCWVGGGLRGPQSLPSEGEGEGVSQSCLTLCNPADCSSVHGILPARILEWCHSLPQGIFPIQGYDPGLRHGGRILSLGGPLQSILNRRKKE